jgi:hypothetical protein
MTNTGGQVEPRKPVDLALTTIGLDHPVEVVDRAAWWNELIGFTMPDDHPATATTKTLEGRVVGADRIMEFPLRLSKFPLERGRRHRLPAERGVLVNPVLKMLLRDHKRRGAGESVERRSSLESEPQAIA